MKCHILYESINMKCPENAHLSKQISDAWSWDCEGGQTKMIMQFFGGDRNTLKVDCGNSYTTL